MPANEQTWRDQKKMHVIFAISAVIMGIATIWMMAADHMREWKDWQLKDRRKDAWMLASRRDSLAANYDGKMNVLEAEVRALDSTAVSEEILDAFRVRVAEQGAASPAGEESPARISAEEAKVDPQFAKLNELVLTPGPLTTSLRTKARDALHGKDRPVALHAAHAVMAALLEALRQFDEEGGQPARLARCTDNCRTLVDGLTALGLKPFLRPEVQAPIIVTWHAPDSPHYEFKRFYEAAKRRGFLIYPGKLTQVETFRVGCIGAIGSNEMQQAVNAVGESLREMGLAR